MPGMMRSKCGARKLAKTLLGPRSCQKPNFEHVRKCEFWSKQRRKKIRGLKKVPRGKKKKSHPWLCSPEAGKAKQRRRGSEGESEEARTGRTGRTGGTWRTGRNARQEKTKGNPAKSRRYKQNLLEIRGIFGKSRKSIKTH